MVTITPPVDTKYCVSQQLRVWGSGGRIDWPTPRKINMQQTKVTASNTVAHRQGNWVRLKFLPLEWAVDTMVGSAQIAELLRTSCGLECRHVDITSGYRHQRGGSGPTYAYAYIQVEHLEDAMAVVSRMSIKLLQGTRVRATLKEPGHPKTYSQGGLVPTGDPGQRGEPRGKLSDQDVEGKVISRAPVGSRRKTTHIKTQMIHRTWHGRMNVCGAVHLRKKMDSGPLAQRV